MVPAEPATQATRSLTGASPRKRAVTPVSESCQDGAGCLEVKPVVATSVTRPSAAIEIFRIDVMIGTYPHPRLDTQR